MRCRFVVVEGERRQLGFLFAQEKISDELRFSAQSSSFEFRRRLRPLHHPAAQGGPPPPLSRGRMKRKEPPCANAASRSQIAKISRSVLRRPGAGRAGLLRLFRFLARLPLIGRAGAPAAAAATKSIASSPAVATSTDRFDAARAHVRARSPEGCRRAGARRVAERILHRDLGQVAKEQVAEESEIMSASRALFLFDQFLVHLPRGSRATT